MATRTTSSASSLDLAKEDQGVRRLQLSLDAFEGPLDLLLHLIRKHELDILDIPIAFVTEEYLRYLDLMQELDLGVAGEYLVMAATLLQIKSQMLVPRQETSADGDDDAEDEDPRTALVRRLLEYQRYREASVALSLREMEGRDVFARPSRAPQFERDAGPADLLPVTLYALMEAFAKLLEEAPPQTLHEVTPERLTLRATITTIADHLATRTRCTLLELVYLQNEEPTRNDLVMTFLALLELAKMRMVKLFQARLANNELYVERSVIDYEEVAGQLDGLEEPE
jgi:segregation and condensation protein A